MFNASLPKLQAKKNRKQKVKSVTSRVAGEMHMNTKLYNFLTTRSLRSLEGTESAEYESYGGNCVHHWLDPFFISFTGKRLQSKQLRF